jgi:hypothetical protein
MTADIAVTPLDGLAEDARFGLRKVRSGEDKALEGWLIYGEALNRERLLFHPEDDKGFGRWVLLSQVGTEEIKRDDRSAAMWAAGYPEAYHSTRKANPLVRTVRGLHAKWKERDKPQPKPVREVPTEDERRVVRRGSRKGSPQKSDRPR